MTDLLQFTANEGNLVVNIKALCNSCTNMAFCCSEFIFTFLYLGGRNQNASEKFVSFVRLYFVDFALHEAPRNKNIV